jgi:hypothetical protein
VTAATAFTGGLLISHTTVHAQNLSGITLQPIENADTLITDLIDHFTGGRRDPKPVIERVVVKDDSGGRLALAITYSGLANCRLAGEVRGSDRRRQPQIQSDPVQLTAATGEAALTLDLRNPPSEDVTIDSAYLSLIATDPAHGAMPVISRVYRLPKQWLAGQASGQVTTVRPEPIGTAAKLGARPDYEPPPKVLVPMKVLSPAVTPVVRDHRVMRAPADAATAPPSPVPAAPAAARVVEVSPAVMAERRSTAAKTTAVTATLPPRAAVMQIDRFRYGVRPEDVQKGAQGPAPSPIELLEGLRTEDIDLNPAVLLNIASSIYPDKNPASGIFYYYPRSYHLEWSPESGPGMRILYGAATTAGNAGDVLMAARLESGLDLSEVQLATELLNAYKRRNPSTVFTVLRPLPLEKDGVDVSLGAVLGQYSIPKEKIAITGLSDVLGEIEVSWVTDPATKENLQLALIQDVGVNGMVAFAAAGGALAAQVPIAIQLADRDSFGRVRWVRTDGYRNLTPYPVRLRYLHALVIDPRNNLPILYSWSLGNTQIAPQSAAKWDATKVPEWIDTEAKRSGSTTASSMRATHATSRYSTRSPGA